MDRTNLLDPHKRIRWDNLYSIMNQVKEMDYPKSRQVGMFIEDIMSHYNSGIISHETPYEDVCYHCIGTGLNQRTKADDVYLKQNPVRAGFEVVMAMKASLPPEVWKEVLDFIKEE
jgi:hypothetical protein